MLNKADVKNELKKLGVKFNPNMSKTELNKLLEKEKELMVETNVFETETDTDLFHEDLTETKTVVVEEKVSLPREATPIEIMRQLRGLKPFEN